jgi:hypothetical protein
MECLKDRIGIMGCDAVEAGASLYVNQLPGITLYNFSSLTNSDQRTFLDLWNNITLRTMKKFEVFVKSEINKCYKIIDDDVIECLVCEKKEKFDVALWYLHGTEVMIERTSTDELNQYTTIDFEKAEQLKADFYLEFQAALVNAVSCITPNDSDCMTSCVQCNDAVKFVTQLP